jgi:hypothetical protein
MVKQSAVQSKVPIKNELNESQLNFFMNSSTSDKFQVHNLTNIICCVAHTDTKPKPLLLLAAGQCAAH